MRSNRSCNCSPSRAARSWYSPVSRSRTTASPTAQAVGTSDPQGYVVEDSPSWRALTGQTFDEMRGRGWLSQFSVGNIVAEPGMPLVRALHWDTGVPLHTAAAWGDVAAV